MQLTRFASGVAVIVTVVANPARVITKRNGLVAGKNAAGLMTVTIAAECNAFQCVAAYAGEIAACAAAAAELGANPIADIACFAALAGAEAVAPVCAACLS